MKTAANGAANVKQLSLELRQYPRPIAWTISEVDRAVGDRDRRDMLLAAFEEILRYLVLLELARYVEYSSRAQGDRAVDRVLQDLRRPSFGQLLSILTTLDGHLSAHSDPYALRITDKHDYPRMREVCQEVEPSAKFKQVSIAMLLSQIVVIRNREKGHGYTGQADARARTALLQPALIELLENIPLLIDLPLVWVESIEYLDPHNHNVTFLELMGTQRARRLTRHVHDPGSLRKNFLYMWNGESAPLQMTPFLHLEETGHDEHVYVLAGVSGEPFYQTRGSSTVRRPDHLQAQLEERAPFLLKKATVTTNPRLPGAAQLYRRAVDIAQVDGDVSAAEREKLDAFRAEVGLSEADAFAIHRELGLAMSDDRAAPPPAAWPAVGQQFASEVRDAVVGLVAEQAKLVLCDEHIEVGQGRVWIQLEDACGVALHFVAQRGDQVIVAVGLYSESSTADRRYESARAVMLGAKALAPGRWTGPYTDSRIYRANALESRLAIPLNDLSKASSTSSAAQLMAVFTQHAAKALSAAPTPEAAPPLPEQSSPVSVAVPEDFPLTPLQGGPRLQGSIWLPRILWALEFGRRRGDGPLRAAEIAEILQQNGVDVPNTNTARAFRVPRDDPRKTGLCDEPASQRYVISSKGRRVLFEWLPTASDE